MRKVITYGTYDLLHYGHIRLLERAKALGDYLIVGVTSDDFDKARGKINVQQSLMKRIEAVKNTGLADKIIVEEYEGQKIDDIRKYEIDIFTVGSDWVGKFDYLNEFCKVVYLDRTDGVSSTEIRNENRKIRLGIVGDSPMTNKTIQECKYVNGIEVSSILSFENSFLKSKQMERYIQMLNDVDAVYLYSFPEDHYEQVKLALSNKKHVLCESPLALKKSQCEELLEIANSQNCVLMEGLKTAYATAYNRLVLLAKEGVIGDIYSVDATCTSLSSRQNESWSSITDWGPTAMLPVFNILGTNYRSKHIISHLDGDYDLFTKINFLYNHGTASIKIGKGVKSEGELVISGTKGYIYVPAPWWKTDYFEVRFEESNDNKRYFYQLDGEGIRYELVAFVKAIERGRSLSYIDESTSKAICDVIQSFYSRTDFCEI